MVNVTWGEGKGEKKKGARAFQDDYTENGGKNIIILLGSRRGDGQQSTKSEGRPGFAGGHRPKGKNLRGEKRSPSTFLRLRWWRIR